MLVPMHPQPSGFWVATDYPHPHPRPIPPHPVPVPPPPSRLPIMASASQPSFPMMPYSGPMRPMHAPPLIAYPATDGHSSKPRGMLMPPPGSGNLALYHPRDLNMVVRAPPDPDAGHLFVHGTPGPAASAGHLTPHRGNDGDGSAEGPYTSQAIPNGPTPEPVFLDPKDDENIFNKMLVRQSNGPYRPTYPGSQSHPPPSLPRALLPAPQEPTPVSSQIQIRPPHIPKRTETDPIEVPLFVRRNAEIAKRGSLPSFVNVTIDEFSEPWQRERQVWQRQEHVLTMYGLSPLVVPSRYKGRQIQYRQQIPIGRLRWNVLEPPSTATYLTSSGQSVPLSEEGLNSLIVDPPEKIMYLIYRPMFGEEVCITVTGTEAGITCGNVLDEIYNILQRPFLPDKVEDRLVNHQYPEAVRIDKPLPMYHWLGEKTLFGGIVSDDAALSTIIGNDYWKKPNTWLLILKSEY